MALFFIWLSSLQQMSQIIIIIIIICVCIYKYSFGTQHTAHWCLCVIFHQPKVAAIVIAIEMLHHCCFAELQDIARRCTHTHTRTRKTKGKTDIGRYRWLLPASFTALMESHKFNSCFVIHMVFRRFLLQFFFLCHCNSSVMRKLLRKKNSTFAEWISQFLMEHKNSNSLKILNFSHRFCAPVKCEGNCEQKQHKAKRPMQHKNSLFPRDCQQLSLIPCVVFSASLTYKHESKRIELLLNLQRKQ